MPEVLADTDAPSDAELISAVRTGDSDAYGQLFARHRPAAEKMAAQLVRGGDVDDLVSESFAKVFTQLSNGAGPDVAFRAYLLTAIRRLHVDRVRATSRVQPTEEIERLDTPVDFEDPAVEKFEHSATAKAFAALPERWQLVLWHLDVEGAKPADIAPVLGMSANSVSALAYRAREGLRQAYLQGHLADTGDESCRWTTEHLGAYVRNGLAKRDRTKVVDHLEGCRRCTGVYLELAEVNSSLAGVLAPALLGAAAPGYLAAGASKGALLGLPFLGVLVGRIRDWITGSGTQVAVVATGVLGIAVAGSLVYAATNDDSPAKRADESSSQPQQAPPAPDQGAPPAKDPPKSKPESQPKAAPAPPPNDAPAPQRQPSPDSPAPDDPAPVPQKPRTSPNPPPEQPKRPVELTADPNGRGDRVTLDWSARNRTDVKGYEVYRKTQGGAGASAASAVPQPETARAVPAVYRPGTTTVPTAVEPAALTPAAHPQGRHLNDHLVRRTKYTDDEVKPGTTYAYRVVAVGKNGGRSIAATATVHLPAKDKPEPKPEPGPKVVEKGELRNEWESDQCIGQVGQKNALTLVRCDSSNSLYWKIYDDSTIRSEGKCITHGRSEKAVRLDECNGAANQRWNLEDEHDHWFAVESADEAEEALDLKWAPGNDPVVLRDTDGSRSQHFTLQ